MERVELNNFSKEDLMERIQDKYAAKMKPVKIVGFVFLLIVLVVWPFIYGIIYYGCSRDFTLSTYWQLPLFLIVCSSIERWWGDKISRCEDAKRMVSLHEKYYKYSKVGYCITLALMGAFTYSLFASFYKGYQASTSPLAMLVFVAVIWVVLFCWILWRLYRLQQPFCNPEIDRLRELAN